MSKIREIGHLVTTRRFELALIVYLASLVLPGLHLVDGDLVEGWRLLLVGWYGILVLQFPWFANPLFLVGLFLLHRGRRLAAGIFGCMAFGVGLLSHLSRVWVKNHTAIESLGSGFSVWMVAFFVLASCVLPNLRGAPADCGARLMDRP